MVDQEGGEIRTVRCAGPAAGPAAAGRPAGGAAQRPRGGAAAARRRGEREPRAGGRRARRRRAVMGSRAFAGDRERHRGAHPRVDRGHARGRRGAPPPSTSRASAAPRSNTDDGSPRRQRRRSTPTWCRSAPRSSARVPLVMLSHALYPAARPHAGSPRSRRRSSTGLLRGRLGYDGVIVTDSIEAQAVLDRSGVARAAERSVRAGADLILMTGSASWNAVHPVAAARAPALRRPSGSACAVGGARARAEGAAGLLD